MGNSTSSESDSKTIPALSNDQITHLKLLYSQWSEYAKHKNLESLRTGPWSLFPIEWIEPFTDWMENHSSLSKSSHKLHSHDLKTFIACADTLTTANPYQVKPFFVSASNHFKTVPEFMRPLVKIYLQFIHDDRPEASQFSVEDNPARLLDYLCSKEPDTETLLMQELEGGSSLESKADKRISLTFADFESWFGQALYLQLIWKSVMTGCFNQVRRPPRPLNSQFSFPSKLLTISDYFLLDSSLDPIKYKKRTWRLLFSSDSYGKSWTILRDKIEDAEHSILVIRDTDGYVFGSFAPRPFDTQPHFYGNTDGFLFSLGPTMRLYRPTSVNDHYMYYNHGTQTFPNGIGFGGQFDFFGLWIADNFVDGHSLARPTSSTYGNFTLSKQEYFKVDSIEVWQITPRVVDDRLVTKKPGGRSILDGPESNFLEMAGKTMYSKQIRDPDPLEGDQ